MTIVNDLWKTTFKAIPSWPCPSCQVSVIVLQSESLRRMETKESISAFAHHCNQTWVDERFSALMRCQNESCGQVVSMGGNVIYEEDYNDEGLLENFSENFEPKFLHPAPKLFPISGGCPYDVGEELERAFGLFWFDTGASANGLRKATEALLNDLKIKRYIINTKRKRDELKLHTRIEKFAIRNKEAAELLMAIKWLTNAGSHLATTAIPRHELLNGFDLFHGVIEMIYDKRAAKLKKAAKNITSRKGRLKKKSI